MIDFKDDKLVLKMKALNLKWGDFEEKYQKGGGKGGQKVNKSTNSVLLRHPASGLEVRVHKFRELWGNRLSAYRLLVSKIEEQRLGKESPQAKKRAKMIKQKKRRAARSAVKVAKRKEGCQEE